MSWQTCKKMKKILHVSHSLDTGGGPLYINKILTDVSGFDHYVAGNSGHYFNIFKTLIGPDKVFKLSGKNIFINVFYLNRICRLHNIDLIHCHGRGASLYSRLLIFFNRRITILYTVHGFHPDTLNPFIRWLYIAFEKVFCGFTDAIINVSKSEQERFLKRIKPNETGKLHYIPNYITEEEIKERTTCVELNQAFTNLVFIGRLSWEKGIDLLVDAWKRIDKKNCCLYIIGYGPMEASLRGVSVPNLVFLGKIQDASSLMPCFDAVIIPSRFEGLPFVGLEAMIQKVNVIATPAVGVTDLFDSRNSWMASDFTPIALQKAIADFIEDCRSFSEAIDTKSNESYRRVKREFSKNNAEKLRRLYQSFEHS